MKETNRIGTTRLPLLPSFCRIVDRQDGTVWHLTHDQSEGRVGIDDTPLTGRDLQDSHLYGPLDGPYTIARGYDGLRWFIRGGRLGYEVVPGIADAQSAPPLSREGLSGYFTQLVVPTSWGKEGDELGYIEVLHAP